MHSAAAPRGSRNRRGCNGIAARDTRAERASHITAAPTARSLRRSPEGTNRYCAAKKPASTATSSAAGPEKLARSSGTKKTVQRAPSTAWHQFTHTRAVLYVFVQSVESAAWHRVASWHGEPRGCAPQKPALDRKVFDVFEQPVESTACHCDHPRHARRSKRSSAAARRPESAAPRSSGASEAAQKDQPRARRRQGSCEVACT